MRRAFSIYRVTCIVWLTLCSCLAAAQGLRPGVVVCPGGSYSWLDRQTEGYDVARWLETESFVARVCEYRTQGWASFAFGYRYVVRGHRHPDPIDDLHAALRQMYDSAEAWGVDTTRIGVMGFSAGGHLALSAACGLRGSKDGAVRRPAFVVAVYPVVTMRRREMVHRRSRRALLGEYGKWSHALRDSLSVECRITDAMPPTMLVNCTDDPVVDYRNSVLLDSVLTAHGIRHLYLQYRTGGHGFGADTLKAGPEAIAWKVACVEWIRQITTASENEHQ